MVSTTTPSPEDQQEDQHQQNENDQPILNTNNNDDPFSFHITPSTVPRLPNSPLILPSRRYQQQGESPNIFAAAANVASAIDKLLNTLTDKPRDRHAFQDAPER